jgi:hypothetical protein
MKYTKYFVFNASSRFNDRIPFIKMYDETLWIFFPNQDLRHLSSACTFSSIVQAL